MIFKDTSHSQRWREAVKAARAVREDGTVKGDFGASLFILTGLPSVYERIKQHIVDALFRIRIGIQEDRDLIPTVLKGVAVAEQFVDLSLVLIERPIGVSWPLVSHDILRNLCSKHN